MNAKLDSGVRPQGFARSTGALRERWWLVLLAAVIVGALTFGISVLLTPRYSATAQLSYSQSYAQLVAQALSSAGKPSDAHNVSNDALVLQTSAFAERVAEALKGSVAAEELRSAVTVSSDRDADLVEVTASGSDRFLVADVANAFVEEFVKQRKEASQGALAKAQELLQGRIDGLTEADASSAYGVSLKQRSDDLSVLISLGLNDYEVLQEARAPTSAYVPYLNLFIGLAAGLIVGLIAIVVLARLDHRVRDQATLERVMDLRVIGTVLQNSGGRAKSQAGAPVIGFGDGNEALLESLRVLRSNLKVLGFGETKRSILITSVGSGEGKSALAVNLALSMALAGDRVVLVDADLHESKIHQYLGIPNSEGLTDVLIGSDLPWSSKIQAIDLTHFVSPELAAARQTGGTEAPVTKFLCLTSGTTVPDPSEMVASQAMMDLLSEIEGISDYVIVDAPPLLVASDSLALAGSVDSLVLASVLGRNTGDEMLEVRQLLARAEVEPLGIVICGAKR